MAAKISLHSEKWVGEVIADGSQGTRELKVLPRCRCCSGWPGLFAARASFPLAVFRQARGPARLPTDMPCFRGYGIRFELDLGGTRESNVTLSTVEP